MKTRILIADSFETAGGEEEVAFYLYENLPRDEFDVFITGEEDAGYFSKKRPKETEWLKCSVKGKTKFKQMLAFRKLIKEHQIDIVHVHGYSAGFFVRVACMGRRNFKVVWTMHSCVDDMFGGKGIKHFVSVGIENILNRYPFFSDEIITVNYNSRLKLLSRKVKHVPVRTIYNGIDTKLFTDAKKESVDYDGMLRIGFVSRLHEQKGIFVLLEAIERMAQKGIAIKLLIAGDGEAQNKVESYISNHHMESYVQMLGFRKDVANVIQMLDVLVLPSFSECFPMIILEAMCSGKAVIGTNINGIPEQIEDGKNGFLIPVEDVDTLEQKLVEYSEHRELLEQHGKNGAQKVLQTFTVEKMIEGYTSLYRELC